MGTRMTSGWHWDTAGTGMEALGHCGDGGDKDSTVVALGHCGDHGDKDNTMVALGLRPTWHPGSGRGCAGSSPRLVRRSLRMGTGMGGLRCHQGTPHPPCTCTPLWGSPAKSPYRTARHGGGRVRPACRRG